MPKILFVIGLGFLEIGPNSILGWSWNCWQSSCLSFWSAGLQAWLHLELSQWASRTCSVAPKSLFYPVTWCLVLGVRLFSAHCSAFSRIMTLTKMFACLLPWVHLYCPRRKKRSFYCLDHIVWQLWTIQFIRALLDGHVNYQVLAEF